MSRGKRPERARGAATARPSAPPPRPRVPWPAIGGVAVVLVVAGVWFARRPVAPPAPASGVVPVSLDSVAAASTLANAATSAANWPLALYWQERVAAALPRHAVALRQLAQAVHNFTNASAVPGGGSRWLLRTSLERVAWESRALALFDSSAALADDPRDRARAMFFEGALLSHNGLPLEALAVLSRADSLVPGDPVLRASIDSLRTQLRDPVAHELLPGR